MRIKPRGKIYSINEGYEQFWDAATAEYVQSKKRPKVWTISGTARQGSFSKSSAEKSREFLRSYFGQCPFIYRYNIIICPSLIIFDNLEGKRISFFPVDGWVGRQPFVNGDRFKVLFIGGRSKTKLHSTSVDYLYWRFCVKAVKGPYATVKCPCWTLYW